MLIWLMGLNTLGVSGVKLWVHEIVCKLKYAIIL